MAHGFRTFRLVDKVVESDTITSFYLQPTDGAPAWDFKPGQYLTLQVPTQSGTVLKTYSLSGDASTTKLHRITVKREAGTAGHPDGVASCWLHDHVQPGDELQIAAPRGVFFLDEVSTRPVLLLSGGVGLTPLVSMLHRLAHGKRDVYFLHACENGRVHALREEVLDLVNKRIHVRTVYRHPTAEDRAERRFDAEGMIDKHFLQAHVPIDDHEAYLCGPTPFMQAMYQLLLELGVPESQIAYEFFGKASSFDKPASSHGSAPSQAAQPIPTAQTPIAAQLTPTTLPPTASASQAASNAPSTIASLAFLTDPNAWAARESAEPAPPIERQPSDKQVSFLRSGKTAHWDDSANSLLELAENAGLEPEFSCRAGICGSCACGLVEGNVEYFEEPLEHPEEGEVLICCARPKGPVVLDI